MARPIARLTWALLRPWHGAGFRVTVRCWSIARTPKAVHADTLPWGTPPGGGAAFWAPQPTASNAVSMAPAIAAATLATFTGLSFDESRPRAPRSGEPRIHDQAAAAGRRYDLPCMVDDLCRAVRDPAPRLDDTPCRAEHPAVLRDRPQVTHVDVNGCVSDTCVERGVHGAARDRVGEGADEAAMDNTNRVVGGLVRLTFEDNLANLDLADLHAEENGDRRRRDRAIPDSAEEIDSRQRPACRRSDHRVIPVHRLASRLTPGGQGRVDALCCGHRASFLSSGAGRCSAPGPGRRRSDRTSSSAPHSEHVGVTVAG